MTAEFNKGKNQLDLKANAGELQSRSIVKQNQSKREIILHTVIRIIKNWTIV